MEFIQFALYIVVPLCIPALMWWGVLHTERTSIERSKRESEERMGGPFIGYS